jgi:hypothetical protein
VKRTGPPRTDAAILVYLMTLSLGAALIGSTLYWLMRPTVYANPGLNAYRAPVPDPIIPRVARPAAEDDVVVQSAIETARRENLLLGVAAASNAQVAEPSDKPDRPIVTAVARKTRPVRAARRTPPRPKREWEPPQRAWAFQRNELDAFFR